MICPLCKGPHKLNRCPGWLVRGRCNVEAKAQAPVFRRLSPLSDQLGINAQD
jgi:hypothetical protein